MTVFEMDTKTEERSDIAVSSCATLQSSAGTISNAKHEEEFLIKRTSNHNEISIMESVWIQIKRKIKLIDCTKRLDVTGLIFGAMIPYMIDILNAYFNKEPANYFPLAICGAIYFATKFLSRWIKFFGESKEQANKLHLDDLKNLIEQVEASSNQNM